MPTTRSKILDCALVALTIVGVLFTVGTYLRIGHSKSHPNSSAWSKQVIGTKLTMPGLPDHALVAAISTNCPYCIRSTSFYQKVSQREREGAKRRFVAALPQNDSQVDAFVSRFQLAFDHVYTGAADTTHVLATPTLLLVDYGVIRQVWVGALTPSQEQVVLAYFNPEEKQ